MFTWKNKWFVILMTISVGLFLSACSDDEDDFDKSKIIGYWKVIVDDIPDSYFEFEEDRLMSRVSETVSSDFLDYEIFGLEDSNFQIEYTDPEKSEDPIPLFEGYFEDEDTIKVISIDSEDFSEEVELIRIDNILEEMADDRVESYEREQEEMEREREEAAKKRKEQEEQDGETASVTGDEIYERSCAACHGVDLNGGAGPDLTSVGADLSEEEIRDVIENGADRMPDNLEEGTDLDILVEWLLEHK